MRNLSPLQEERLKYQPKLPSSLASGISSLDYSEGSATESVANQAEIKELFANTYGKPVVTFSASNESKSLEARNVGVILSGGQAPGGHNVIAGLYDALKQSNSQGKLYGFLGGPSGIIEGKYVEFTDSFIDEYRNTGGFDIIGSGRTKLETEEQFAKALDVCKKLNISAVVIIGGDDSNTNAALLAEWFVKNNAGIQVIGCPKTIDGDLKNEQIEISFGFDTAVASAVPSVRGAHVEARNSINGIGLVKLMGREAGFIAAAAALSSHETNFCLIPEVPFEMEGENGFLACLERRLAKRGHAVIVVSEGAGQDLLTSTNATDASGNKKLADIGVFLKSEIEKYFKAKNIEINLKYIDPSYQVRASVTTASDSIYCERLGNNAVHAAMAGKTKCVIGLVHDKFVHLPIKAVTAHRNAVDPEGSLWRDTLDATGQPILMCNDLEAARAKMAAAVAGAKSKPSEQKKSK